MALRGSLLTIGTASWATILKLPSKNCPEISANYPVSFDPTRPDQRPAFRGRNTT
jgi:hypothetical protein